MLKHLKSLLNNKIAKPRRTGIKIAPNMSIRQARHDDLDWMQALFEEGMRDGHYMVQPLKNIRSMLAQIIERGAILRHAPVTPLHPEGIEGVAAWLDVIEKEETPAGFVVSAQRSEGSEEIEIYQLSVVPEYRRQGLAILLVDYAIKQHELGITFYARCYPTSNEAFSLLLNLGFKHTGTQPLGTRELYRHVI